MKRVLLLQLRPEDEISDNEYEAIMQGGLLAKQIDRIRIERNGLPKIDLAGYAAVIVGGGPSNVCDPLEKKSSAQQQFEPPLIDLLCTIIAKDIPYLGICYGMSVLTVAVGGTVSKKYPEPAAAVEIHINEHGMKDPLLAGVPKTFKSFVGHKEATEQAPPGSVILASSELSPVQMYKIGKNVYATQYHPELNHDSFILRVRAYQHLGYFSPDELEPLIEEALRHKIEYPEEILKNFIKTYISR